MPTDDPAAHLVSLILAAEQEARRLGPPAEAIASSLASAATAARELEASGGAADEGLRPDQLTTDNDR